MKPIYQLYDEWTVVHQICLICKRQMIGPKTPTDVDGTTMEQHIRKEHPGEVKD